MTGLEEAVGISIIATIMLNIAIEIGAEIVGELVVEEYLRSGEVPPQVAEAEIKYESLGFPVCQTPQGQGVEAMFSTYVVTMDEEVLRQCGVAVPAECGVVCPPKVEVSLN